MPRRLVRSPGHSRRRSLGWLAVEWMEYFTLHGRGDARGMRVAHGEEMSRFVADCYALEPSGRLMYDSAFLSRPKGTDKSGLASRFVLFEALGPCRFDGVAEGGEVYTDPWGLGFEYVYERGEPMGRPVRSPFIRCLATEEGQTGNVYDSVLFNLTNPDAPLHEISAIDAGLTRTILPGGGEIIPSTAGNASKDGGLETFAVFDESHLYNLPELRGMYDTVTRNMRKRKRTAGTWYLETTTMFAENEKSVAEATYQLAEHIEAGRARRARALFDHRWGECEDVADEDQLREALIEAFGEALEWNDIESLIDEFYDPRKAETDSRRYFLNAPSGARDAWLTSAEWADRRAEEPVEIGPREPVVLGFDGSRRRSRGVTDATALVGIRVTDGHVFQIRVWEQPPNVSEDWEIPRLEVHAAVDASFGHYNVVGFYADPALWESDIAAWEAKYGPRLKLKASAKHPIEWWMTGGTVGKVVAATKSFHDAVTEDDLTHDGALELTAHVLHARRRPGRSGVQIAKEHPESPNKIDAAVAAILAWQARLDALAAGLAKAPETGVARRLDKAGRRRRGGPSADRPL